MFKHIFPGYILPKDKQSMISMIRQQVQKHLDKGGEGRIMILPIQRCLDNRSRNIRQCASHVLVDIRNTSVMLRGSINMVLQVRVGVEDHKKYTRNNCRNSKESKV